MDKPKILFLSPRLPYPLDTGGKIRTYHILRLLAGNFSVDLLTFIFSEQEKDFVFELEKQLRIKIHSVDNKIFPPGIVLSALRTGKPISYQKYFSVQFVDKLKSLLQENQYRKVHCDHLHMAQYVTIIKQISLDLPVRVDEHNVEYVIAERTKDRASNPVAKLLFSDQSSKVKRLEKQVCQEVDEIWVVSQEDKLILSNLIGDDKKITVVPNGVDLEYFSFRPYGGNEKGLVFIGSMDWLPNEDGMLFFIEAIWPKVKAVLPDLRLSIVGRSPSDRLLSKASWDIVITGAVDDVRPYLYSAEVSIVPLRIGGGSRLKILESMAAGRVVVSTSLGAEGIECVNNEHIIIADNPDEFASAIIRLVRDITMRKRIAKTAYDLVEGKYKWKLPYL